MIKFVKIRIGMATVLNLSHPVIFEPSNREGVTLPDSQPLLEKLNKWQDAYSKLNLSKRELKANNDATKNISKTELSTLLKQCDHDAKDVLKDFNIWLESNTFIKEIYEQQIDPSDQVQILLQIEDKELERLPWHLADIFKRFSSTEVALYKPPISNRPPVFDLSNNNARNITVKILAVFGDDSGIDTENDLAKLKHLFPDLVYLGGDSEEKLTKQTLFEKLTEEQWDILFFAGHSSTSTENQTGKIYLHKECEGLEFKDISNAIDTAVEKGLKIAIFNSCDGLGLGHSLSRLGVPQIILMREPVPDKVAQAFLNNFLGEYSKGNSFYQSVSHARKNLQGLDNFPCADWLPTIYQSSKDYPPSWVDLHKATTIEGADIRDKPSKPPDPLVENPPKNSKRYIPIALGLAGCIFVVTSTIVPNRKRPDSASTHEEKWQPYQNAEIQFDYPSQWRLDPIKFTSELENDIPGATLKLYSSAETNKSCPEQLTLNIKTTPVSGYTLDLYRQDKIRRIRNPDTNNGVQLTELTTPGTKLANRQAYRLNFERNDRQCKIVKSIETGMIDRDKIYVLNYSFIPDGREESRQQIFDRIVTSFKIK